MAFREARPFLLIALVLSVLSFFFLPWLTFLPVLALIYILYFFRDPEREISADPRDIVAPADGVVISVGEFEENVFTQHKMKRVAIFLSVFDVHVNRAPVAGTVKKTVHKAGEFLDARHPEIDVRNESLDWWLETARGTVVVRQIAGLIARRIVAWSKEGDNLAKGERFGMIRFGSRTDVYLPQECEVLVEKGQRVAGGSSLMARWPEN
jgi:phosphatidylserine decarboxylase